MHPLPACARCDRRGAPLSADGLCPDCRGTGTWAAAPSTESAAAVTPWAEFDPPGLAPDASSPGPTALSRFEVLGALGRGGMGAVWKVRERATGEVFALKTLGG